MVYLVKLAQSGHSVYMNLPKPLRRALRLHRGDQVYISVEGDRFVVTKSDSRVSADIVAALHRGRARGAGDVE